MVLFAFLFCFSCHGAASGLVTFPPHGPRSSLVSDVLVPAFVVSVSHWWRSCLFSFLWFHTSPPLRVDVPTSGSSLLSQDLFFFFFYNLKETVKCSHNLQYWFERHFTGSNGTLNNL